VVSEQTRLNTTGLYDPVYAYDEVNFSINMKIEGRDIPHINGIRLVYFGTLLYVQNLMLTCPPPPCV
jgi:hypothetical protein